MSFIPQRQNRHHQRISRRNADINMTNLMDVMMVLLVVFMVAAPLMTTGIAVNLPKVGGKAMEGKDTSINVSVDAEGYYYIGETEIPQDKIIEKIEAIRGENGDVTVTISGDQSAHYGRVIGLMAMLKEAGFEKVGLQTQSKPMNLKKQKKD